MIVTHHKRLDILILVFVLMLICISRTNAQCLPPPTTQTPLVMPDEGGVYSRSPRYGATLATGQGVIGISTSAHYQMYLGVIPYAVQSSIRLNPCATDSVHDRDITYLLPWYGTFPNGTVGWSPSSTGSGVVNSYTGAGQHWVGLSVGSSGGSATLDTYNGSTNSYIDLSGNDIFADELYVCMYVRVSAVLAGTFRVTLYSANTAQPLTLEATIGSDTGNANSLIQGSNFERLSFLLAPITQDYLQIKNLELNYSVSAGATIQTTEIVIGQVYLTAYKVVP